jgi:hypothetical protein
MPPPGKILFMKFKDYLNIVPAQYIGKEIDVAASMFLQDEQEAIEFYELARQRLLNVNEWHDTAGFGTGRFHVADSNGELQNRHVQQGDHFRVEIPGPGSKTGEGYDWVLVEAVAETEQEPGIQSTGIRVRPTTNPCNDSHDVAHFYDSSATSCFIVTREALEVKAMIIDNNVKPNEDAESATDLIRNIPVAAVALTVFSKWQWQRLADGIVAREEKKAIT